MTIEMKCPKCNAKVSSRYRFCPECGESNQFYKHYTSTMKRCYNPQCRKIQSISNKFCVGCGDKSSVG